MTDEQLEALEARIRELTKALDMTPGDLLQWHETPTLEPMDAVAIMSDLLDPRRLEFLIDGLKELERNPLDVRGKT